MIASNWFPLGTWPPTKESNNLAPTGPALRTTYLQKAILDSQGTNSEPQSKSLMRQLIHLCGKFESSWESISLLVHMGTSPMGLFSVLIRGVRKLSFCKRTTHLPLTPLWILQGQKKSKIIRSRGLQPINSTRIDALKRSKAANPQQTPWRHHSFMWMLWFWPWCFPAIFVPRVGINHWRKVCRSSKPNRKQKNARGGSKQVL